MNNILIMNGLPSEYEGNKLSTDFRNMIQVSLILDDEELSDSEKSFMVLHQLYEEIPKDIAIATKGLEWFYTRGQSQTATISTSRSKIGFDFEQDANLIYSAFYATYQISLTTITYLHWWEFMALFEGLPEDTLIKKYIYYRTVDDMELSKEERKHVQRVRNLCALKKKTEKILSLEEVNQMAIDRMNKRFEDADKRLNSSKR